MYLFTVWMCLRFGFFFSFFRCFTFDLIYLFGIAINKVKEWKLNSYATWDIRKGNDEKLKQTSHREEQDDDDDVEQKIQQQNPHIHESKKEGIPKRKIILKKKKYKRGDFYNVVIPNNKNQRKNHIYLLSRATVWPFHNTKRTFL